MKHLRTMSDLTVDEIYVLIKEAIQFKNGETWNVDEQIFVCNLFHEASTRTKSSFEVAQRSLGMEVIPFEVSTSSVQKGETLYDTVKTLEMIGVNVFVIRHSEENYFHQLEGIQGAIINGGDGCGNHPTQSLLDLMTIFEEYGKFEGLNITICGDILHSRVARSNAEILQKLGANVTFVAPEKWQDPTYNTEQYISIDEAVKNADVLMLLRIQHERHTDQNNEATNYHKEYGLTIERELVMKEGSIIMHPAPVNRGVEIDSSLVECERSRIFEQMRNGMFMRMAVLKRAMEQ
ncbi:aspartate carbamoyltransferase catalytic subunit [Bacillus alkalisoli]|uniref:aspartate carbamoyltransferase catalytic subunit n=1 Tax=Bacillus alkalisoli TaxID=2011008 RepID=UPI0012FEEBFD